MAKKRVGRYPKEFRRLAVERLNRCENIAALSKELGVCPTLLYKWRWQLEPRDPREGPPVEKTSGASSYDTWAQQNPTAGAIRAAEAIEGQESRATSLPELIDRETGVQEILEILESIIAQAGDLIESRSPELVAEARAALKRYSAEAANTSSE